MPTMTIYIAPRGTPLADGGTSQVGHMYYTLTDSNGVTYSYGFAPAVHGEAFGAGRVYTNDSVNYQGYQYKRDIPISESQFQSVLAWSELTKLTGSYGDYAGVGNNCITYTFDAMKAGGFNPTFTPLYHNWWPTWNGGQVDNIFYDYMRRAEFNREFKREISPAVNTSTTAAINWVEPRRDPLVLDLDGNGITTSGINPAAPILFDQDGDGTLTATGWIAAGEAIVVRDLNGNGRIDSGRELFGDNTVLTRGPNAGQRASNGFTALADLDANAAGVADGKFDASDVAFASVKLWKDANQNGISEAAELFTFAALGVQSINLAATATSVPLIGGNTQTFAGTFTREGGAVSAAATAELVGSLLLTNNNFYRQFTDDPAITNAAQALPQMQGSGWVRDLREAMSGRSVTKTRSRFRRCAKIRQLKMRVLC